MPVISMKALLESGVHFGHRTHKWNPRMKPYIFTERNGIHIINLQQTVKSIEEAYDVIRDTVAAGGTVLFIGTKRQAQETVQEEATRCGMPHVSARWLGGMLTNWRTIRERINELDRLERMRDRGDFEKITKKEALILSREIEKLDTRLGGIRKMVKLPDLLFIVDVRREETAIHEANLLRIPVVAMVDTNCDPSYVDYVIPSNDDAIRAIKLVVGKIADAVLEGRGLRKDDDMDMEIKMAPVSDADETELADEDLLGAATLAKLQRTTKLTGMLDEDEEDEKDYTAFEFDEELEAEDEDEELTYDEDEEEDLEEE
ncbi:MAG: 30S ribosomal protein S2 [Anaerolineales bacterium]|nr:30S ribosomal protein S2 [Anaerolineales bacterium]